MFSLTFSDFKKFPNLFSNPVYSLVSNLKFYTKNLIRINKNNIFSDENVKNWRLVWNFNNENCTSEPLNSFKDSQVSAITTTIIPISLEAARLENFWWGRRRDDAMTRER